MHRSTTPITTAVLASTLALGMSASVLPPAAGAAPRLVIAGRWGGGIEYLGIPWRTGRTPGIGSYAAGGGILFVGIPHPPPGS